jgi:NAD(P)H-dependent FMN reductase
VVSAAVTLSLVARRCVIDDRLALIVEVVAPARLEVFRLPAGWPHVLSRFATTPAADVAALGTRFADAFAIVTPEYSLSFPDALKNAIDHYNDKWKGQAGRPGAYGRRARSSRPG